VWQSVVVRLPQMGDRRLLLVEDDDDVRASIADVLDLAGYVVVEAANGRHAMRAMRDDPPRGVILDLMMPVMSGWEVLEQMRADPALAGIPVCLLSAQVQIEPVDAVQVLQKPVSVDDLLAVVQRMLQT
jgi:two-component system chemotaxis response regulator CheY